MKSDGDGGTRVLMGAIIAGFVLPVMVLGLKAPLWLGVIAAAATLAGAMLMGVRPRRRALTARTEPPVRAALEDAAPALARLDRLALEIAAPPVRAHVAAIAAAAREIEDALRETPQRLGDLHRVFTYYLPRAAALADAYALLESRTPADHARMDAIGRLLQRIEVGLKGIAAECSEDALAPLDVELRLMDAALREDLER